MNLLAWSLLAAMMFAPQPPLIPGEFDRSVTYNLTGSVERVTWGAPTIIEVSAASSADAPAARWRITAATADSLANGGFNQDSLHQGVKVVLAAHPSTDRTCRPACKGYLKGIKLFDERKSGPSGLAALSPEPRL